MTMTREELYQLHDQMTKAALILMCKKNADYASDIDPFRNFRTHGLFGIVVRLGDKLARLQSLVERGVDNNQVKDETYLDTCHDIINYAVLFAGLAGARPVEEAQEISFTGCQYTPTAGDPPGLHPRFREGLTQDELDALFIGLK
jgi:hypothetical protein